ncbi:hypothetical protein AcW1_006602 [Taiwanofungus camphoratus]|nr:hypothetical protein AcW1_006602 [Antrodia cinnamomea]
MSPRPLTLAHPSSVSAAVTRPGPTSAAGRPLCFSELPHVLPRSVHNSPSPSLFLSSFFLAHSCAHSDSAPPVPPARLRASAAHQATRACTSSALRTPYFSVCSSRRRRTMRRCDPRFCTRSPVPYVRSPRAATRASRCDPPPRIAHHDRVQPIAHRASRHIASHHTSADWLRTSIHAVTVRLLYARSPRARRFPAFPHSRTRPRPHSQAPARPHGRQATVPREQCTRYIRTHPRLFVTRPRPQWAVANCCAQLMCASRVRPASCLPITIRISPALSPEPASLGPQPCVSP